LDAALSPELLAEFDERDFQKADAGFYAWNSVTGKVREYLMNEFRLMYWGSPLRKALDAFRLYHKTDMASALTCAYNRHRLGKDPLTALREDYSLGFYGILTWTSREEVKARHRDDWLWNQVQPFFKEGDRLVNYRTPPNSGTLLLRGDRLVWEVDTFHGNISAVAPSWQAAYDQFQALGGNRGFLAGEFVWPPEGWVNPVSDAEDAAALNKELRPLQ
jgi:hypothetical protein